MNNDDIAMIEGFAKNAPTVDSAHVLELIAALKVSRQEIVNVENHGMAEIQKLKAAIMDIYENGQDGKWDEETIRVLDKLYPDDRD